MSTETLTSTLLTLVGTVAIYEYRLSILEGKGHFEAKADAQTALVSLVQGVLHLDTSDDQYAQIVDSLNAGLEKFIEIAQNTG